MSSVFVLIIFALIVSINDLFRCCYRLMTISIFITRKSFYKKSFSLQIYLINRSMKEQRTKGSYHLVASHDKNGNEKQPQLPEMCNNWFLNWASIIYLSSTFMIIHKHMPCPDTIYAYILNTCQSLTNILSKLGFTDTRLPGFNLIGARVHVSM